MISAQYFIQLTNFNPSYVCHNNLPKVRHSGSGLPRRFLIASRTVLTRTFSPLQYRSLVSVPAGHLSWRALWTRTGSSAWSSRSPGRGAE